MRRTIKHAYAFTVSAWDRDGGFGSIEPGVTAVRAIVIMMMRRRRRRGRGR